MKRLMFSLVLLLSWGIAHGAEVKYYDVPRGAHPHDVAPDPPNTAVRQMLGRKGEAWGAESGADRLVVVKH